MTLEEVQAQISGPHLLYVSGEDVDWQRIEEILADRDRCTLGPHCWILRELPDRNRLADAIRAALPTAPKKCELLFAPLSPHRILYATQQGFGLAAWLDREKKQK